MSSFLSGATMPSSSSTCSLFILISPFVCIKQKRRNKKQKKERKREKTPAGSICVLMVGREIMKIKFPLYVRNT
jgi:hypothetical protein